MTLVGRDRDLAALAGIDAAAANGATIVSIDVYAPRHLDAALRAGQHDQVAQAPSKLAMINTCRGDVDDATALAKKLVEDGVANGDIWNERGGLGQLGVIALTNGDGERIAASALATEAANWLSAESSPPAAR